MTEQEIKNTIAGIEYLVEKEAITQDEADRELEYYIMLLWQTQEGEI